MKMRIDRLTLAAFAGVLLVALSACQSTTNSSYDPDLLKSMRSSFEQQRALADCLAEDGWKVTFDESTGAVVAEVSSAQEDTYDAALEACSKRIGVSFDGELTEEQMETVYEWYKAIAVCLDEHGWPVPDQPTFSTFSDTYDTNPWIPWVEVPSSEMPDATRKCPVLSETI